MSCDSQLYNYEGGTPALAVFFFLLEHVYSTGCHLASYATLAWKGCSFEWEQLQSLVGGVHQLSGMGSHGLFASVLALLYDLKVPRWDFQTGRQLRTSPLYDRLDAQGARWMEKHGFERPKYFVPPDKGKEAHSFLFTFLLLGINTIYF